MNHLMNLIDGFASVVDSYLFSGRPYVQPCRDDGFRHDRQHLRNDAQRVSNDIKAVISEYGNQGGSGEGYKS